MKSKPGGERIEWPVSGWPRHGPLIFAFFAVLLVLLLALFLLADSGPDASPEPPEPVEAPAGTS